jgi:translation initiation factor IF-1
MPGFKNTSGPQGKKAVAANSKNKRSTEQLFSDDDTCSVGRVDKSLGFSQFKINFHDGEESHEIVGKPCGTFRAGGKARIRIANGDFVILAGPFSAKEAKARGSTLHVEIIGKLTPAEAQKMFNGGRIHKSIYAVTEGPVDDIFDYTEEDVKIDRI